MKVLNDIAALREAKHPELAEYRSAPADEHGIAEIRGRVGLGISALERLLSWRNGESLDSFLLGEAWRLLPVDLILERYDEIVGEEISLSSDFRELNGVEYWPDEWVPFVEWNAQIMGVIDFRIPGKAPVIGVDLASCLVVRWALSIDDFFDGALRDLATRESVSVDRLMRSIP